jgi:hypothetical protein
MRPDNTPTFSERLARLKTPEVRHLLWAVGSAPLMVQHKSFPFSVLNEDWFDEQVIRCWPLFEALDQQPVNLLSVLADGPQLLGKRFERLLAFFFDAHPDFEVVQQGWSIQGPGKSGTVGEFDFILKALRTGEIWHMEVACKFYLAARNAASWAVFKGPNPRDTLAGKMDKLVQQLALSDHPVARKTLQDQRIRIDQRVLLMKGGLFHHLSNIPRAHPPLHAHPRYPAGWWIHRGEWQQLLDHSGAAEVYVLPKPDWMGGFCREKLDAPPVRPALCARAFPNPMPGEPPIELDRGFIVPDSWPN